MIKKEERCRVRILNLRIGFATNSSSSHSIIFIPGNPLDIPETHFYEFGWDNFILSSKKAKSRYLVAILKDNLKLPDFLIPPIIFAWLGIDISEENLKNCYIDHQSALFLPKRFGENIIDPEFFEEFKKYILQENLVILGGNDNNPREDYIGTNLENQLNNWVCRKDVNGNFWSLFNKKNGDKVRFRFTEGITNFKILERKTEIPELVDIKITDYCLQNCPFCYAGSHKSGEHAKDRFWGLAESLAELKVFEVCLGGGEPLSHPDFLRAIKEFNSKEVSVSFTTREMDWLRNPKVWLPIKNNCSAFGYTPKNIIKYGLIEKELLELNALLTLNDMKDMVKIHIPMGIVSESSFLAIIDFCERYNYDILLLGFKNTGRAINFKKESYDFLFNYLIKDNSDRKTGIDTLLAKEIKPQLDLLKVPELLYNIEEGIDSCYIDLVNMEMAKSSFSEKKVKLDDIKPETIKNIFNSF